MNRRGAGVVALTIVLVCAGCGGSSSSPTSTSPTKQANAGSYRQQVDDCLKHVGYKTRDAGNALRVERPTGDLIANVQTFKSEKAAARFARHLVVDGRAGGRGVAVFLRDADGDAKTVVTDCLTP